MSFPVVIYWQKIKWQCPEGQCQFCPRSLNMLLHPLFWNLCTYWFVYKIIYCTSVFIPVCFILSKSKCIYIMLKIYFLSVCILLFIHTYAVCGYLTTFLIRKGKFNQSPIQQGHLPRLPLSHTKRGKIMLITWY